MTNTKLKSTYPEYVAELEARLNTDKAMKEAVGGEFIAVGKLEYHLLRSLGLRDGHRVVDVGCGSGRLAAQLAPFDGISYLGCDVVPKLLGYAENLTKRPDWKFVATDGTRIPCDDGTADFVVFFSVFTHLTHEDTFKYFREARRCLRPQGLMVFSFLEFRIPCHWDIFSTSVDHMRPGHPLSQFIDREGIKAWAQHCDFEVQSIWDGDRGHIPIPEVILWEGGNRMETLGNFGQSVAVLRKRD